MSFSSFFFYTETSPVRAMSNGLFLGGFLILVFFQNGF